MFCMEAGRKTSTAPDMRKSRRTSVRSASCRTWTSIRKTYTDAIGSNCIRHGSAEVRNHVLDKGTVAQNKRISVQKMILALDKIIMYRVNGHYSLNYVYTSLKKEILNALVVDKQSIEDVVESWNSDLGKR